MNCRDFRKNILLFTRRESGDKILEQGLNHARSCRPCSLRLEGEKALLTGFSAVRDDISEHKVPARIEADLLAAFNASLAARIDAKSSNIYDFARRLRAYGTALVTACVVLLLLTGLIGFNLISNPPKPVVAEASLISSPGLDLPTTRINNPGKADQPNRPDIIQKPLPKARTEYASFTKPRLRPQRSKTPPVSDEARFYPLATEDELIPLESGQVVRVKVSLSSLISLGIPIKTGRNNQSVEADLLVGQDGIARAIRPLN